MIFLSLSAASEQHSVIFQLLFFFAPARQMFIIVLLLSELMPFVRAATHLSFFASFALCVTL